MKSLSLSVVVGALSSLGVLTRASFIKAAKAQGYSKKLAEEFWEQAQTERVRRPSMTAPVKTETGELEG